MKKNIFMLLFLLIGTLNCAGGSSNLVNEGGSEPINSAEVIQYKQALHRCYKTGGSRIVKINSYLQCY